MKQHKDYLQVTEELSKKQVNILRDWAVKKGYNNKLYHANYSPSIGQMIEFLKKDTIQGEFFFIHIDFDNGKPCWIVQKYVCLGSEKTTYGWEETQIYDFVNKELCDALWEAVKEVLKWRQK